MGGRSGERPGLYPLVDQGTQKHLATSSLISRDQGGQEAAEQPHPNRAGAGGPAPDLSIMAVRSCALSEAPVHCSSNGDKHREIQSSTASEINRCAGSHRSGDNSLCPAQRACQALHLPEATEHAPWEAGCVFYPPPPPPSLEKWVSSTVKGGGVREERSSISNKLITEPRLWSQVPRLESWLCH